MTPVVGSGQGLIVFGRFQYESGENLYKSAGWAGAVVTRTSIVAMTDAPSGQNTGIAIVNPSNSTATLTLTLKNTPGTTVATRTLTLNSRRQIAQFVDQLLEETDANGILSIVSNVPVVVLGLQFQGNSFSVLPTDAPLGQTALVIPQYAKGSGWSTGIVVANTSGSAQTVRIDIYDPEGGIFDTVQNVRIPAGGVTEINR
jgi:hypothetical protein